MGHSVLEMVSHSIATSHIDEGLTKTLIVPIPKVDSPTTLRDFRPISLCNVLLKVVSKVIMNKFKLRPSHDSIIGALQRSFIPGRRTSDNTIIAQVIVHHLQKKKKGKPGHLMFKIDFEKTYDSVD